MWAQVGNCVIFKAGKSICKRIYRTLGSKVMSYAAAEGEFLEEVRLPGFGAFIYPNSEDLLSVKTMTFGIK
jgi:hypothetical protein